MLVVVKTPPIRVEGEIPEDMLHYLELKFNDLEITEDDDEETISLDQSEWFQEMKKKTHSGRVVWVYRDNKGWSQRELGERLGGIHRQVISEIERGKRAISKNMALKLAKIFDLPVERFLKIM